ncbi:MAG: hypothetical protein CFE45_23120 [Burkholderiales bacterium PBB5]|nr:MAG: hypothetical protein CFE45_23120 [Burkholderiales bacterium PBB5]
MPVRYLKKHAALEGQVSADDAEALGQWLRDQNAPVVHLGKCDQVHSAVLQVLMALRPRVSAPPADPWLAEALNAAAA